MMQALGFILLLYFYIAIAVFIVFSVIKLVRWTLSPKGKDGTFFGFKNLFVYPGQTSNLKALKNILSRILLFSSMKRDPKTRVLSLTFHWSLWIILAAHLDLILEPKLVAMGIPFSTIKLLSTDVGTTLAMVLVISGLLLIYRRASDKYLSYISNYLDYVLISYIVVIGISGLTMRLLIPDTFAYNTVSPFIYSLFTLKPDPVPIQIVFDVHFFLGSTLALIFPFTKLFHPFSFFTNPTLYSVMR
ncbi:MAG: respiratory nitrate reductase subunit gamma [Thermoplasmata archaeon]